MICEVNPLNGPMRLPFISPKKNFDKHKLCQHELFLFKKVYMKLSPAVKEKKTTKVREIK